MPAAAQLRESAAMHRLARLDQRCVWHPFTQMRDWLRREPTVIVRGRGAEVEDAHGRRYLDANASIWTNLHGHRQPRIDAAVRAQLGRIAHSSALGLANEPAALLAEQLVRAARLRRMRCGQGMIPRQGAPSFPRPAPALPNPELSKVFYSDDGSTALEVALKLAYEFSRRSGRSPRPRFLTLQGAYHGDTIGAVSLGHIDLFHRAFHGLLFPSDAVPAPYCYRCRFNRARPERRDARDYRRCEGQCLEQLEERLELQARKGNPYAGFVFEPLLQGAAGMIAQPTGWLRRAADAARKHSALLIADEVMTGFGRTGIGSDSRRPSWFACHHEDVQPDFLCLAKGLTGGYLPMAATLTTTAVFEAFLGEYEEFRTFFHGHSYTGNQLGAAAALANFELLQEREGIRRRKALEDVLAAELERLWAIPQVGDVRRVGLIAGIELVRDWRTREPFDLGARAGIRVCEAMAARGVLTRPVGNVVVLMPPYCTTPAQLRRIIRALCEALQEVFGSLPSVITVSGRGRRRCLLPRGGERGAAFRIPAGKLRAMAGRPGLSVGHWPACWR